MPELPEVETMRRGIGPCVGRRIEEVERVASPRRPILIAPRLPALRRRLLGTTIAATERAGKRVVLVLSSSDRLVFEPRMTGLVLLSDPPTAEHLRFRLRLSAQPNKALRGAGAKPGQGGKRNSRSRVDPGRELMYWDCRGLGSVRLLTQAEFAAAFAAERLGPDALEVTADALRDRFGQSRRAIKVGLLDQRAVAGIGNLYASEILHVAGLHPAIPCRRLRPADWQRLADAIHSILEEAIRYEGSTLSDGTYRNALNEQGSYQNHHQVYDRAGQPCPRCRAAVILRIVQAQRATFFCPGCQVLRRRAGSKARAHFRLL